MFGNLTSYTMPPTRMSASHTPKLLRSCCARCGNSLPRDGFGFCFDCQQEIDEYDVRAAISKAQGAQP